MTFTYVWQIYMNEDREIVSFSQLSNRDNWFELVLKILPLLETPQNSGFKTVIELVSALAASRGQTPRALSKQVDAAKFVISNFPELVKSLGVSGGHSQIEFLAKIHKFDKEAAIAIAPAVIQGNLTMTDIRKLYTETLERSNPVSPPPAVAARRRAMEFEKTCLEVILANKEVFGASNEREIIPEFRSGRLVLDVAVLRYGHLACGVECKIGGVASAARDAMPILAKLTLFRQKVDVMWLLVPDWARHLAETVKEEAIHWGVTGVRVGTVSEDGEQPKLNVL